MPSLLSHWLSVLCLGMCLFVAAAYAEAVAAFGVPTAGAADGIGDGTSNIHHFRRRSKEHP